MREQKPIEELSFNKEANMTEVDLHSDVVAKSEKRKFREAHDCYHCRYRNLEQCPAVVSCPLEVTRKINKRKAPKCPRDETNDCPYGNDAGTCFGFCWREILRDFKRERESKEE